MRHRDRSPARLARPIAGLAALALFASTLLAAAPAPSQEAAQRMIVTGTAGSFAEVAAQVEAVGGEVVGELPIVEGVVAELSPSAAEALGDSEAVRSVTPDVPVAPASTEDDTGSGGVYENFDAATAQGSLARHHRDVIGSGAFWNTGHTGEGVDVAVVDTGIATVAGLDAGQVLLGPDLSFDSQVEELAQTDGYGHGTHMAGIVGGREASHTGSADASDTDHFLGVAPDSRLVSVKIGDHGGAADVSQAIAAIDWVTSHRNAEGPEGEDDLDIRVMNLSFGYDSSQSYTEDPLAYAAEQAWNHGIVVVAAAGNGGHRARLSSPAYSPHVLAVGATDSNMTRTASDDVIPDWTSCDPNRNPDVVAPGRSVVSLRVPGSYVDSTFSTSRVTDTLTRGTGTSQSAAFVSGAAALILSKHPDATPDQVRALLNSTAQSIQKSAPKRCQGHGVIDLHKAATTALPSASASTWNASTGTGTLDAARGGYHVQDTALAEDDPNRVLHGERDIFGHDWDGAAWRRAAAAGEAFSPQGYWNGAQWTGAQWTGAQWTGAQWTGAQWTSNAWSGSEWAGAQWTGAQWTGAQWTGAQWTGAQWTGAQWTGAQWTGAQWTSSLWASLLQADDSDDVPWTGFLSATWE